LLFHSYPSPTEKASPAFALSPPEENVLLRGLGVARDEPLPLPGERAAAWVVELLRREVLDVPLAFEELGPRLAA